MNKFIIITFLFFFIISCSGDKSEARISLENYLTHLKNEEFKEAYSFMSNNLKEKCEFNEFENKVSTCIYVSATPGDYEAQICKKETLPEKKPKTKWDLLHCAQQIIRPTGLLDPIIEIKPSKGQIDDILSQIKSRLKKLVQSIKPKGFGVIVRTVAIDKKVAELDKDLKNLYKKWIELCRNIKDANMPSKVQTELNRSSSILRDIFDDSFSGIHVNQKSMFSEIKDYLSQIAPKKQSILKLHRSDVPIFEHFKIERQIKTAFGKTVTMSKGAYLIIEHTEALHVIDVNSGNRSAKSKNQEETALEVNLIAATEIARQLRLRDMGGIIVIDFIDMLSPENRKSLFDHFKNEMESDRAKHKVLPPSKIGLIQMTRQRVRSEMDIKTKELNPNTSEMVEAPIVLIDKINNKLEKILNNKKYENKKLVLHLHPFVAAYVKSGFPSLRSKWYFEHKKWIKVIPRDAYTYLHFRFFDGEGKIINL